MSHYPVDNPNGNNTHHKGQPFNGIIFNDCELILYKLFEKKHHHPKVAAAILEEDCAGGSMYRLTWSGSNIGHNWKIYCFGCKQEEVLLCPDCDCA